MADSNPELGDAIEAQGGAEAAEEAPGAAYKVPEKKSLEELKKLDEEDEALRRYKESLLGAAMTSAPLPDNPNNVVLTRMRIEFRDHPAFEFDLRTGGGAPHHVTIKEGVEYQVSVFFFVQREIVSGMKYTMATSRKGLPLGKDSQMMGSYPPSAEEIRWTNPVWDEAPKGMLSHGTYKIKCKFADDDKNELLNWEWALDIKKDWKD